MRMPGPEIQKEPLEDEENILRTSPLAARPLAGTISPLIQREPPLEDEEKKLRGKFLTPGPGVAQKKSPDEGEELQAKAASDTASELDAGVESRITSLRGGGQPLPEAVRNYFEPRFGYDFSQVRVHNNSQAAEPAQAVNARAFTLGNDIVFGAGQYAPEHPEGKKLIAHELVHVIQQNGK
ncbi:MAG: DUF4157 domain-containing protein [Firmicutes bacterium]|nr:DUF4157 domain-containing protein [Bacillota bacterium]